ncbi:hypothetical protein D9758_003405 [Tetrapyrgos nigripes]|uniref:XPG-I domain-containing protein n=1 Tax=Tetrapyrgos nigripes TaxID=182062 RepID=A0A8H5LW35_9AGAR|nr:hypothetical protein D9758_003405 [Tetrapyrgos nigripes]
MAISDRWPGSAWAFWALHPSSKGLEVIKYFPDRLKAFAGKRIVIDGTLVTQRLHFAPVPHPYRHIIGWYRLIKELEKFGVQTVCVFDGKERSTAKAREVIRRRQAQRLAAARGLIEDERLKRLTQLHDVLGQLSQLSPAERLQLSNHLQREIVQQQPIPTYPNFSDPFWSQHISSVSFSNDDIDTPDFHRVDYRSLFHEAAERRAQAWEEEEEAFYQDLDSHSYSKSLSVPNNPSTYDYDSIPNNADIEVSHEHEHVSIASTSQSLSHSQSQSQSHSRTEYTEDLSISSEDLPVLDTTTLPLPSSTFQSQASPSKTDFPPSSDIGVSVPDLPSISEGKAEQVVDLPDSTSVPNPPTSDLDATSYSETKPSPTNLDTLDLLEPTPVPGPTPHDVDPTSYFQTTTQPSVNETETEADTLDSPDSVPVPGLPTHDVDVDRTSYSQSQTTTQTQPLVTETEIGTEADTSSSSSLINRLASTLSSLYLDYRHSISKMSSIPLSSQTQPDPSPNSTSDGSGAGGVTRRAGARVGVVASGSEQEQEQVKAEYDMSRKQHKLTLEEGEVWDRITGFGAAEAAAATSPAPPSESLDSESAGDGVIVEVSIDTDTQTILDVDSREAQAMEVEVEVREAVPQSEEAPISSAPTPVLRTPEEEVLISLTEKSSLMSESYKRSAQTPTTRTYNECKEILAAMGVPCVEATGAYEAEAVASSLVLNGYADYVASEDTDVLVYEAPLIRNITNRNAPLVVVSGAEVRDVLQLTRDMYIDFALLLGTDFSQRIKNVGPARALKFIRAHGCIEKIVEEERKFSPRVPKEDYMMQVVAGRAVFGTLPPITKEILDGMMKRQVQEGGDEDVKARFVMEKYGLSSVLEWNWEEGLEGNYFGGESGGGGGYFGDNPSSGGNW